MSAISSSSASPARCFSVPTSRDEAESLLKELRDLDLRLLAAKTAMDVKLAAVRMEHEPVIKNLERDQKAAGAALEQWAWSVHDTEFADPRSIEMTHGTVGFRWGPWKLALLSKMKWETVLSRLQEKFKKYIRTKEEVDKEAILKDSGGESPQLTPANLSAMGMRRVQEESFFVDFKQG